MLDKLLLFDRSNSSNAICVLMDGGFALEEKSSFRIAFLLLIRLMLSRLLLLKLPPKQLKLSFVL